VPGLVVESAPYILRRFGKWKQARTRRWDSPLIDAITYVQHLSALGETLPEEVAFSRATDIVLKAAERGKLRLWGRHLNETHHRELKRSEIKGCRLIVPKTRDANRLPVGLSYGVDREKYQFVELMTDKRNYQAIWPHGRGSWAG
jgi:hypothetical protein